MKYNDATNVLTSLLRENNVYLGGSALGKGFRRAARWHLQQQQEDEESFYVVDIGVVVSQYNQWRIHFPRVACYYAVKCNPDPLVIQTLAILGANFDCASQEEISLVQTLVRDLPRQPDIIYANPCKARSHIRNAVQRGVTLMTFDNVNEVEKCASISKQIELILRIITNDSGSVCRLSSKYGAPRETWRDLLQAAKDHGLKVVGISFHVGSGCRDASRYELALRDAKELHDVARDEYGFDMNIIDIGGGFPGETHSLWNPAKRDKHQTPANDAAGSRFMFFDEIAEQVSPLLDEIFPESSQVKLIAEPGRYLVAASCTLLTNVIGLRSNVVDKQNDSVNPIPDKVVAAALDAMTREDENHIIDDQVISTEDTLAKDVVEEMTEYAQLFARQNLAQQEVETYTHSRDLSESDPSKLLCPPEEWDKAKASQYHTAEGVTAGIVADCLADIAEEQDASMLAAVGEAAIAGVVLQSVADSVPMQDDFAYYVNDGVYGAFNNLMFDHATVRPRPLWKSALKKGEKCRRQRSVSVSDSFDGFPNLSYDESSGSEVDEHEDLYTSTIFGPTCDSIDVISRSVLLPKLHIGDWLYFQNMGAYTMAAASSFNGFTPTEKFYVCSVKPKYFDQILADTLSSEEKKED
jgi:ornithine decarboxylase